MDVRSLEHFVAVTEYGGFAEASRHLHITQPTLSRSIALLENRVGAKLFERNARGTAITDDGRKLLPHALSVLSEVRRAKALFEQSEDDDLDRISIAASPSFLHDTLPQALAQVLNQRNDCAVEVQNARIEDAIKGLRSRKVDIALCLAAKYANHHHSADGLIYEEVGTELLVPVARADHPVFNTAPTLESLATCCWAVPFELSVSYRFETAFFRRDLPVSGQKLNSPSLSLLRGALLHHSMIAILPRSFAAPDLRRGTLREVMVEELRFENAIIIAWSKALQSTRRANIVASFVDAIRARVADGRTVPEQGN